MKKLDLDRLHKDWMVSSTERGSGRTTKMLISAIQNTISGISVVVVGHTYAFCKHLRYSAQLLATEMGYNTIREGDHLKIDGVPMLFLGPIGLTEKLHGLTVNVFQDHYIEESFQRAAVKQKENTPNHHIGYGV